MSTPGTIWRKIAPFFGAPPQWVQVGNFAMGIAGTQGPPGRDGLSLQGPPGPAGPAGISSGVLRGQIDGFVLSNDATSPNTVLDIGAGTATDSTGTYSLTSAAFTKTTAAWAAGSGNGGLFSGAIAATTWYHAFAIHKTSDGSIDFGIDTSVTAANIPVGYNAYRRLGSILTDASSHITAFHQYGDEFYWDTSVRDVNASNPGTAAVSATLSVPTGLKVQPIFDATAFSSTVQTQLYFSSLDSVDLVVSYANGIQSGPTASTSIEGYASSRLWTNTSAQIRYRLVNSDANMVVKIRTRGWLDQRGKNS